MVFQPVLPVLLLVLLGAAALAVVVVAFLGARGTGRLRWGSRGLLVLLMVTALLRPGVPGGTTTTLASDTDVFLVVDTTASIVAEDWGDDAPRLDGVRADVAAIIAAYPGARFALLTFDADPQLRLPLTTDAAAVTSSMDVLRPEVTAQSRGSSIGVAADLLTSTLASAASQGQGRARMVFYLGDGEQTVSSDPESFADAAQYVDGGLVLGYGTTTGGRMPVTTGRGDDGGYISYEGADALSVIDEDNLRAIADDLGVDYVHRSADVTFTPPATPATSQDFTAAATTGNVTELFWIPVIGVVLLLGVEVALTSFALVTAGAARPKRRTGDRA